MKRLSLAALIAAAAAAPAAAQCVTSADLDRGIVVRFESGDSTTMRRLPDGYLEIDESYASGSPTMRFFAHRGIYFVEEFQLAPDRSAVEETRLRIEFPVDPARLPDPLPGVSWDGETTNVFADGYTRAETVTIRFTEREPLALGDCTYEAVDAAIRYDWGEEGGLNLTYIYLPEVGTALLTSSQFDGDALAQTTPISIRRLGTK